MMVSVTHGVSFPTQPDGRQSSTAVGRGGGGRARPVDPVGAGRGAETAAEPVPGSLQRLIEAGIGTPEAWRSIAESGLEAVHRRMVVSEESGEELPLASLESAPQPHPRNRGGEGEAEPEHELVVPYLGRHLHGAALRDQLSEWCGRGVIEPSAADAVVEVSGNPGWLRLEGHQVVVFGAGAEMGPLARCSDGGPRWPQSTCPRLRSGSASSVLARAGAGRLLVPVRDGVGADVDAAAALVSTFWPRCPRWRSGCGRAERLVLGNYLYADGGAHVRVCVAADVLATRLTRTRPDTALAYLSHHRRVRRPRAAVEASTRAIGTLNPREAGRGVLRWATRGRLLHRAYPPGADPGIGDSLVPVQGQRTGQADQHWRAAVGRHEGQLVSLHVAPSTRTRSVVKNRPGCCVRRRPPLRRRDLRARHGEHLMAALLVHDITRGVPTHQHPWQDEAYAAVRGELWRAAYEPRSVPFRGGPRLRQRARLAAPHSLSATRASAASTGRTPGSIRSLCGEVPTCCRVVSARRLDESAVQPELRIRGPEPGGCDGVLQGCRGPVVAVQRPGQGIGDVHAVPPRPLHPRRDERPLGRAVVGLERCAISRSPCTSRAASSATISAAVFTNSSASPTLPVTWRSSASSSEESKFGDVVATLRHHVSAVARSPRATSSRAHDAQAGTYVGASSLAWRRWRSAASSRPDFGRARRAG